MILIGEKWIAVSQPFGKRLDVVEKQHNYFELLNFKEWI